MTQQQPRLYLGYGLLANPAFTQQLLGRHLKPWETAATIHRFRLKVLQKAELPKKVQDATDEGFRIYGLVEDPTRKGQVEVRILDLSRQERIAISALNFDDDLYRPVEISIDANTRIHNAIVEVLREPTAGTFVENGLDYPHFLNDREASMANARVLHDMFIRPFQEGNQTREKESLS